MAPIIDDGDHDAIGQDLLVECLGGGNPHTLDADLIYVLEGSATFVTGGSVPDAKASEPNELRSSAIVGGEGRRIIKGDVIVVPPGVPHMFKDVQGTLNYYVVKVR